ncbi:MAG: DEAD/DEAH box helicase [Deltaproteobacteria bacterium]|nr:DEAD/DEAH box helicase [Deltaproteobacteria bacterium]
MLRSMAAGRAGPIPGDLLARHVLSVTAGGDWPVREAAMQAVLRRWAFAERDGLHVDRRPAGRKLFGTYLTKRQGKGARPYTTALYGVDPLAASCDCPDFLHNSLGLCKHVLVVTAQAIAAKGQKGLVRAPELQPALGWNPVRPMTGAGDWLARLRWIGSTAMARGKRALRTYRAAARWFEPENGSLVDADALALPFSERLQVVSDLAAWASLPHLAGRPAPCEPAVAALLAEERRRLTSLWADRIVDKELNRHLASMKHRLYPYQRTAVRRILDTHRLLLADDMGLGKTIEAIAACHVLWREGSVRRGLIVAPASLKSQWHREWNTFSDILIAVVDGPPSERLATYRSTKRGFLIANYEQVLRDLEAMQAFAPDMVVLDEAQRIKNFATKTAAAVKRLRPEYRLVLTGTPMENRLDELASILEWVDPLALEPTWRLGPWHTALADGRKEVVGARHLDTLRARLSPCMLRRVRQEVLAQLPPRTDTRIPVELSSTQQEEHDGFNQSISQIAARAKSRPLTQAEFLRLMQLLTLQRMICNGMALYQFDAVWPGIAEIKRPSESALKSLGSPKLLELRELVEAVVVAQQQKVVIFSQWRRMLRLAHWSVQDLLARAGGQAVFFSGEESQKRRTQNIIDFHDDPRVRVLFATDAGGVGLNLQRAATCCINLELPWNPAVLEQRVGRIHRLGQKRPIEIYNLVCETGIEARIADIVGNKKALFTGLFDGSSDQIAFEKSGTFLQRVERMLPPPAPAAAAAVDEQPDEEAARASAEADLSDALPPPEPSTPLAPAPEPAPATTQPPRATPGVSPSTAQIAALFEGLRVERREGGGLVIHADPEAAFALGAVFSGLAASMAAITDRP